MKVKSTFFPQNTTLKVAGKIIDFSKVYIMGILNLTPDSFYDGGHHNSVEGSLRQAAKMIEEGADWIDIGGMSSRPNAEIISVEEELKRVMPSIEAIVKEFPNAILSIDTIHAKVAKTAAKAGVGVINDISGGNLDENMLETIAALKMPYILMHMRGTPSTMTKLNHYDDLTDDILDYFTQKLVHLDKIGIRDVIIDPGFGFSKNIPQNFELMRNLDAFKVLGKPLLVGISRKSMIWRSLGITPKEALNGTSVLHTLALQKGANILRVHDVKAAKEVIHLFNLYNQ